MVNMYGAGKAFNLRFQQRGISQMRFRQPQPRMPIMTHCHGHHSGPTNVTINQGPQGFWGFLGGFFGGLFGSGILGGLFGGRQQAMYNPSPYGMLNQQMMGPGYTQPQQGNTELAKLNQLFSGYKIVPEDDGKFSATKDNKLVAQNLTYDEMVKTLGGANTKVDGTGDGAGDAAGAAKAAGDGTVAKAKVDGTGDGAGDAAGAAGAAGPGTPL